MKREMISEELIDKVLAGKGSADEAKSVSSWLGTDEGQLYLASHMDLMLEETLSDPEEEGGIPTYNMYEEIQNKIRERSRTLSLVNWAAALAVLLALSLFVGERFLHFSPKSFSAENSFVPRGEKMTFLLSDGTKAVVNSDTRFGYPRRFGIGKRVVSLEGEAFFDVAKSWFRPFIIRLGDAEVRVYGTQFNVKAYPEEDMITVGLESGKVAFCSGKRINVTLAPGEMLSFNKETRSYSVESVDDISLLSAWKSDTLLFDDSSLGEMVRILSRLFDVEFKVQDERLLQYSFTLTTTSNDLSHILDEIALITPVRFERKGTAISVWPD